jgi:hypothetical protein
MTTSKLGPSSSPGENAAASDEAMMTCSYSNKNAYGNKNAYRNEETPGVCRFGRGRWAPRVDQSSCGPMLPGAPGWGPSGAPAGAGWGPSGAPAGADAHAGAHAGAVFARLGRNMNLKSQTLLKIHLRRALIHVET